MEARKSVLVSITVGVLVFLRVCHGVDQDLTFEVAAGNTDCFWEHLKEDVQAELEYQVIDGGDLDIDFVVSAPDGEILIEEHRRTENTGTIHTTMTGEYKFCFGNSFSRMASKVVFFELVVEEKEEDDDWKFDMDEVQEMVDMTLEDIKGVIDRSKGHLDKSIQLQLLIKIHEARDRNVVEANLSRVNIFSAFQVFVMITVSLTQVLMIRSLFREKGYGQAGLRQST
ncbi:transmembrane emp24 domain-containing protein 1-like [Babylonia areolata]|uniref:transmembrane emp24 domain-containing protein 1-like n=1 Tax=Babylonia areolata TaxID=304850 RepID=UPI003FD3B27D